MADYEWTAGQEVFLPAYRGWAGNPGRILVIDRVTPSGRAVIGSTTFDKSGREIGGTRYHRDYIIPATDQHRTDINNYARKQALLSAVETIKWRELTPEQVEELAPVLIKFAQPKDAPK